MEKSSKLTANIINGTTSFFMIYRSAAGFQSFIQFQITAYSLTRVTIERTAIIPFWSANTRHTLLPFNRYLLSESILFASISAYFTTSNTSSYQFCRTFISWAAFVVLIKTIAVLGSLSSKCFDWTFNLNTAIDSNISSNITTFANTTRILSGYWITDSVTLASIPTNYS